MPERTEAGDEAPPANCPNPEDARTRTALKRRNGGGYRGYGFGWLEAQRRSRRVRTDRRITPFSRTKRRFSDRS